jgi:hypothetical protein
MLQKVDKLSLGLPENFGEFVDFKVAPLPFVLATAVPFKGKARDAVHICAAVLREMCHHR